MFAFYCQKHPKAGHCSSQIKTMPYSFFFFFTNEITVLFAVLLKKHFFDVLVFTFKCLIDSTLGDVMYQSL